MCEFPRTLPIFDKKKTSLLMIIITPINQHTANVHANNDVLKVLIDWILNKFNIILSFYHFINSL